MVENAASSCGRGPFASWGPGLRTTPLMSAAPSSTQLKLQSLPRPLIMHQKRSQSIRTCLINTSGFHWNPDKSTIQAPSHSKVSWIKDTQPVIMECHEPKWHLDA